MNITTMHGIAVVTATGIRFLDKSYTCSLAIQECWFEKAHTSGYWFIAIYYLSNGLSQIYFIYDEEIVTCYEIHRERISFEKLEAYFKSIQRLKRERALLIKPDMAIKES